MRALVKTGVFLLLLAGVLIAAGTVLLRTHGASGAAAPGSRLQSSETRPLAHAPTRIELSGPMNLVLNQGPIPSLEVRGEQRLLANVGTTLDGDVLRIGPRGLLLRHRQPIELIVTLPQLTALSIDGSGAYTASGFAGPRLDLRLAGSGNLRFNGRYRDIAARLHGSGDLDLTGGASERVEAETIGSGRLTLVGSTRELDATLRGSGDLDARHLQARDVRLVHEGSGDSTVYASSSVNVELDGSGDATVFGNPAARTVRRVGSGNVVFRD